MDVQEHTLDHLLQGAVEAKNAKQFAGTVFRAFTKPIDNGSATRSFVVVECDKADCNNFDVRETNRLDLHPDEFNKFFTGRQWRVSGYKKAICPDCRSSKKANRTKAAAPAALPHDLQPDVLLNKTFGTAPEVIDADYTCEETTVTNDTSTLRASEKAARAEMYLDDNFVKLGNGTGYYRAACSDQLGAVHSHMTLSDFKKLRVESYGEVVDYAPVIATVNSAMATAERALTQVNAEKERLDGYMKELEHLPDDVQAFLNDLRATHEALKLEGLAKLEKLERELDEQFAAARTRAEEAWAAKQHAMEAAVEPKMRALNEQGTSLERTMRTLTTLQGHLPAELVEQAAA